MAKPRRGESMIRSRFRVLRYVLFLPVVLLALLAVSANVPVAPVPTIQLQPVLISGLTSALYVTNAHDGSNRLFIVEQPGRIQVLQPGQSSPTLFLDITSPVLFGGEQGLLGLAFHPQFK